MGHQGSEGKTVTGIEIGAVNETIMAATRKGWVEWAESKQFCQITNGLNGKTIIKLYRCVIQPKVFYGLSAWNTENLGKTSELQNTVLHTVTGGYSKPAVRNLELLTGVKLVDIQIQILTIKRLSKVLSTNDSMKKYILEIADTNQKVRRNLKILKCFLAWKFNSRTNRNIDINEFIAYILTYNQAGQGHFVTSHLGDNMASVAWATKVSTKWVDQIDRITIFKEISMFVVWLGRFAPLAK